MKKIITTLILIILLLNSINLFSFGSSSDDMYLDVKIGSNLSPSSKVTLSSDSGFALYNRYNKDDELAFIESNKIIVSKNFDEIHIYDMSNGFLMSFPGDGSTIIGSLDRESIVQVDSSKYRDYITFISRASETLLINHIDMENYLYGVVPKEILASAHMDALKAQALVARSYALSNLNKHISDGYNLCDTIHCQVYGAYDNEKPTTNQAVDETKGEYVMYNGQIANTFFHSTSGGYTEDSSKVWGGALPYLVAVEDSFSSNSPNSSWTITITPRQAAEKLLNSGINIGEVIDMEVIKVSDANRVLEIKLKGSLGETIVSGEKLRGIFGSTFLKSAWFSVDKQGSSGSTSKAYVMDASRMYPVEININNAYIIDGNSRKQVSRSAVSRALGSNRTSSIGGTYTTSPTSFVINGKGYGHGVGMSQYGAMEMARLGYNYNDIIKHYFKGVEIANLNR